MDHKGYPRFRPIPAYRTNGVVQSQAVFACHCWTSQQWHPASAENAAGRAEIQTDLSPLATVRTTGTVNTYGTLTDTNNNTNTTTNTTQQQQQQQSPPEQYGESTGTTLPGYSNFERMEILRRVQIPASEDTKVYVELIAAGNFGTAFDWAAEHAPNELSLAAASFEHSRTQFPIIQQDAEREAAKRSLEAEQMLQEAEEARKQMNSGVGVAQAGLGALQVAGTIAAVASMSTPIGWIGGGLLLLNGLNGLDNVQAGIRQAGSGEQVRTGTFFGAQEIGTVRQSS